MLDFIEKVIYINLAHRTDRKEMIEKELSIFPSEKVIRFEGISDVYGYIGCTKSHIGALKVARAHKWKNVLIVEDDMQWNELDKSIPRIEQLASNPYDVIVFGGGDVVYNEKTNKLFECTLAHCYLVSNHYYSSLINNLEEGLPLLVKTRSFKHANDQYWKRLQRKDSWYIVQPPAAVQRLTYSDNEKRQTVFAMSCGKVISNTGLPPRKILGFVKRIKK